MATLRDCPEPKVRYELEHSPDETIHVKGVKVDCFRSDRDYYERFTYPSGRIRWMKLETD